MYKILPPNREVKIQILQTFDNPSHAQHLSLPSPRSPRRPKANIRVLDAFGREETPSSSPKKESNASRNGIRVLDAMGRDIEEGQSEELDKMEESTTPLSRDVLLTRLRRGLNELVEDIDVVESNTGFSFLGFDANFFLLGRKMYLPVIVRVSKNWLRPQGKREE
jgi:hypothetical protein